MDIKELRALVRQRHNAATSKVSRLRQKGVEVGGTELDPRRAPADISKMRRRDLETHLRRLNGFVSRQTSFAAGSEGVLLPGAKVQQLKNIIKRYENLGRKRDAPLSNIQHPGAGADTNYTLANRQAMMTPNVIRAGGTANNRPFAPANLKISNIESVDALNKMIQHYQKKVDRSYLPDYLKGQRQQAYKMMNDIGVGDQIKRPQQTDEERKLDTRVYLDELTDDQFDTLFNDTEFAGDLGMRYGYMSLLGKGKKHDMHDAVMETNERDIAKQIGWAANLPARVRSDNAKPKQKTPRIRR